jgi:hypothetical protein
MVDWEFVTEAFRDPPEVREETVNGIEGATLAEAVREDLLPRGFACEELVPEDFGWVFHAEGPEGRYLLAFSLEPGEHGAGLYGRVAVSKRRSLGDRLRGRNAERPDEALPRAVGAFLAGRPEIRELREVT